jgi:hypothetical protein
MHLSLSRPHLSMIAALLILFPCAHGVRAQMALTAAGSAAGYRLTTFATGFPTDTIASGVDGPNGIAFIPSGGVAVSDHPGNVRVFPTTADGQSAGNVAAAYNYGYGNALGLARVGSSLYLADQLGGSVLQLNLDGTLHQTIVSNIPNATGIVANPNNGHLLVSNYGSGEAVWDVDPVAKTDSVFVNLPGDGDGMVTDGTTLYVKSGATGSERILGFRLSDKTQVFTSPVIDGADGVSLGLGTLAGSLFVNTNFGQVYQLNLATQATTLIASGGSRGDFLTAAPDGTLFVTQSDSILRLTAPSSGAFGGGSLWTAKAVSTGVDAYTRILWNKTDGTASVWKVNSAGSIVTQQQFGPYSGWTAKAIATGQDNLTRLLWTNTTGAAAYYLLDSNNAFVSQQQYGPYSGWTAQGLAVAPDNTVRALWTNTNGTATVWTLDSANRLTTQAQYGPYSGWTAQSLSVNADGSERLLWTNTSGTATFWKLSSASQLLDQHQYGPYSGYTARSIASAPDGTGRVVWAALDAHIALWTIDGDNAFAGQQTQFGPYSGYSFTSISVGSDGNTRLLWDNLTGQDALWSVTSSGNFASNYQFGPY